MVVRRYLQYLAIRGGKALLHNCVPFWIQEGSRKSWISFPLSFLAPSLKRKELVCVASLNGSLFIPYGTPMILQPYWVYTVTRSLLCFQNRALPPWHCFPSSFSCHHPPLANRFMNLISAIMPTTSEAVLLMGRPALPWVVHMQDFTTLNCTELIQWRAHRCVPKTELFLPGTALPPFSDVTVLLSLTVFMNLVSAIMPTTSDAVPLIGRPAHMAAAVVPRFSTPGFSLLVTGDQASSMVFRGDFE